MLSNTEVVINLFVLFLLPLTVHSLITGRLPPEGTLLGRLYRANPRLHLASDLFLLALCFTCLGRLALHFNVINAAHKETVNMVTGIPFAILLVIFLGLLVNAGLRLRRSAKADS